MRGPYSLNEVIAAIRRGEIGEATRVSNDGCAWTTAGEIPALEAAMDDPIDPTARVERAAESIKLTRPGEIGKTDETEEAAKSLKSAKTLRVEKSDGAEERNAFKEEGASDSALASCGLLSIVVVDRRFGRRGLLPFANAENQGKRSGVQHRVFY